VSNPAEMLESPAWAMEHSGSYADQVAHLHRGELAYQRCAACGAAQFPPRTVCTSCSAEDPDTAVSRGRGTVHAVTAMPRREGEPRRLALLELEEGFRVMAEHVGGEPPSIGDAVHVKTDADREGFWVGFTTELEEGA
jgi:uncharacterized protein